MIEDRLRAMMRAYIGGESDAELRKTKIPNGFDFDSFSLWPAAYIAEGEIVEYASNCAAGTIGEIEAAFATFVREGPTGYLSAAILFSASGGSNWPYWRRTTGCPPYTRCATMRKPAG